MDQCLVDEPISKNLQNVSKHVGLGIYIGILGERELGHDQRDHGKHHVDEQGLGHQGPIFPIRPQGDSHDPNDHVLHVDLEMRQPLTFDKRIR